MSDSVRPHRRQPTRLPRPWDSPGRNTGVGCHFLLQCMKVKSESEVAQSCLTLSDPMDCSPPGCPLHGPATTSLIVYSHPFALPCHQSFTLFLLACAEPHFTVLLIHRSTYRKIGTFSTFCLLPDRSNESLCFRKTSNRDYNRCICKS